MAGCARTFLCCTVIAGVALVIQPTVCTGRPAARRAFCIGNLKQLSLALRMYTDDADDCFPPANEWQDAVSPYLKAEDRLRCPNRWGVKNPYAYNTGVQGRPLRRLPVAARQPVLFETGQDYRNGNDRLESFVKPHGVSIWSGVGHVAYADGHVKGEPKAPAADAGSALSAGAASPSGGLRE